MTRNIREHMEVEIALLAGVLGFFLGGLINVRKEIIDIFLSAVVTGVLVFFTAYYAVKLILSGAKKNITEDKYTFQTDNFDRVKSVKTAADKNGKQGVQTAEKAVKGKKLDLTSRDDSLFDDLYKR